MYKLCFYVPEEHLEAVKMAVFDAGAGKIGAYDGCCWQVLGEGQFTPQTESSPFLGEQGKKEVVAEYKVELVCDDACIEKVLRALCDAHPYEEPAFQYWQVNTQL